MTTPGDEFVAQQLSEGLNVTGEVAAGIYGDTYGITAPPQEIDLSKAAAVNPDIEALEARIKAQQAAQAAAAEPLPAEPEGHPAPALSSSVASDVVAAFASLHDRLVALERKVL